MTQLLNDDGTASMATAIMSSHHAFRRDLRCFARALADGRPAAALAEEWARFRDALHGHHTVEDSAIFPGLRDAPEIATLEAQHRAIDPLLEQGDAAFRDLAHAHGALEVIRALDRALAEHLELEERVVIPSLRGATEFPPPPDDAALALYADGFAWSTTGLAPAVQAALDRMLPPALVVRLPSARAAFDARCLRVWGHALRGSSTTSVP
jgi:hypothetical protein